jgi:lipid-A-disaccharide synthase
VSRSVLITSGESSGELYASLLAREIRSRFPDVRIIGIGGEMLKAEGVEVFSSYASAMGIMEAFSAYKSVKETLDKTFRMLESERPDAVVLIDYPDFNFRVAERAKALGIKVLYYVSPQIWVWRPGRINTMKRVVDRIAAILPFEVELYEQAGIPCEFVGHPVMEEMASVTSDKTEAKRVLGLDADKSYITLLPGSRHNELSRLLPLMLETARLIRRELPEYGLVLSAAPSIDPERYRPIFSEFERMGVVITRQNAVLLYTASEAAVVASGTAALQGVFRETPMVVVYKINWITYFILKAMVKVKYVNIANIILDKEAIPELLQHKATPRAVLDRLMPFIRDKARREALVADLRTVRLMFEGRKPSQRVIDMLIELAGWSA